MGRVIARSEATKQSSTALRTGLLRFARNAEKAKGPGFPPGLRISRLGWIRNPFCRHIEVAVADFDHFKMYVAAALDRLERT